MFDIKIARLKIRIDNQYRFVEQLCRDYIVIDEAEHDLLIRVDADEIRAEMAMAEVQVTEAYAESVCVYRKICRELPTRFQSYLMHCAVIEYRGEGYAFAAQSGTGKSTHIALWQKRFGDEVHVVNGDKPIMRFEGDRLLAFGTPWCGKEWLHTNTSVPLKAICFLERAPTNSIHAIDASEAILRIFRQILTPDDLATVDALIPLLDRTLKEVPCYVLGCNISEEAAEVAYNGMNQ